MSERLLVAGTAAWTGCLPKGHAVSGDATDGPADFAWESIVAIADNRQLMNPLRSFALLAKSSISTTLLSTTDKGKSG
jgi:hypothetical protein